MKSDTKQWHMKFSLKDKVETFNKDLKLACLLRWLTSAEAREEKQHGSVILTFKTESEVNLFIYLCILYSIHAAI